jgi:holo-[acyl-carrier protein] synthase
VVGVDVVDVARFSAALARTPGMERRLFTSAERDYCRASRRPDVHLAGTLAAKEAVIKALRLGSLAAWAARVEIRRAPDGAPYARVGGRSVAVSISHDGPVAVAVALAPGDP